MGQRFLLRGTTGRKRAATRARPRRCLASDRQKESLSIASVGLPDRASWCPRSHRCCARVTRVTAARLLTLEAVATCGHDCDRLGFTDTARPTSRWSYGLAPYALRDNVVTDRQTTVDLSPAAARLREAFPTSRQR